MYVEHLLENRVCIVEELRMKAKIIHQSLCDIGDVTILVSDQILFVIAIIVTSWSLHVLEAVRALNEADEDNLIVDLREDLHNQINLCQVAFFCHSKQLPLNLDHIGLGCLKVALDQTVMHLGNWSRCDNVDVFAYKFIPLVLENVLDLLIAVDDGANFR